LPLHINRFQWQQLVLHFLKLETVNHIANKMDLGRGQVLQAFGISRTAMTLDTPIEPIAISSGSKAPEKVYVHHHEKYHLKERPPKITSRNPIASLNGVYTLIYRNKKVRGKLISGQAGITLEKMLNKSAGKTILWSTILAGYIGIITKTHLYCLNDAGRPEYDISSQVCYPIWVRLKELIAKKHGIRREQLPLYLGEIIWRWNFKKLNMISQRKRILSLIQESQYQ
jgi:hypothetical protein